MVTTADSAPADEGEAGRDESRVHLLGLHLDPGEIEALGLRLRTDGVALDLDAIAGEGRPLGALLARASGVLAHLLDGASAAVAAAGDALRRQLERLRRRLLDAVRRLVRYVAGRLVQSAADQLAGQPADGSAGDGDDAAAPAEVLSPEQSEQVLSNMPTRQVRKLAQGMSDEEVEEVAASTPAPTPDAARAVRDLERAARKAVEAG